MHWAITPFIVVTIHGLKGGCYDRLRDKIYREAQTVSMNPQKQMPGLIPGSVSRPADVYVAFDISITSPTQAAYCPGGAIDLTKASKNRAHFSDCRAQGIHFQPLMVESFGKGLGIGDQISFSDFVCLQRGNAALIIDRDQEPAH